MPPPSTPPGAGWDFVSEGVLSQIWQSALAAPFGVKVETTNPMALRAKLSAWRVLRQGEDIRDFDHLHLHLSPTRQLRELWIYAYE